MRTLCALVGMFFPLTLICGCQSDSSSEDSGASSPRGKDSGSRKDVATPGTSSPTGSCTVNGQTHQIGEAFVDNCITWLCTGPDTVEQVSGTFCSDAHAPDAPGARKDARADSPAVEVSGRDAMAMLDGPQAVDQGGTPDRPAVDQGGMLDRPAMDAGRDAQARAETKPAPDAAVARELPASLDVELPEDAPEDAAMMGCMYLGVSYAVGESFPSDCNTCFCRADGDVVCTTKPCSLDGGIDLIRSQARGARPS